jgi:hypothetical protein
MSHVSYSSYRILHYNRTRMNDNIGRRTNENNKTPSPRSDHNKNQLAIISVNKKDRMKKDVTKSIVDRDPKESDE